MEGSLTHLDTSGKASMVDVSGKAPTVREATARGQLAMRSDTLEAILAGNTPKGSVIETARIAGIMAAKQTSTLIPLCHPLPIAKVAVDISANAQLPGLTVEATVKTTAPTGVEMEALTAVSVAVLTLYDMAKALEKTMVIQDIRLLSKRGGRSGDFVAESV